MRYYNPLDKFYKSTVGGVTADEKITFRVKGNFDSVVFVLRKDGESEWQTITMNKNCDIFSVDVSFSRGLYYYCFDLGDKFIGLGDDYLGEICYEPKWFQLTVSDQDYKVPEWLYGGIIYQIFPDRFCRAEQSKLVPSEKILHENWNDMPVYNPNEQGKVVNNDFFGGDFKGIIGKLDYLKQLGVTAIYLNPIFKAFSNHRYDTGDYKSIDPMLGTQKDFEELIKKAGELDIKLILDGVFNHTGDDSLYFNKYGRYSSVGAYQSKNSPYYDWFNFTDYPNEYDSWWGITTLPAVNERSQGFIDYITGKDGVLEYYTKLGIGGWRLDVVDELPADFVRRIRCAVKGINPNATIIGEVWEDASNKISYGVRREYFQGKELDGVMNYPLKDAIIHAVRSGKVDVLSNVVKEQLDHYPNIVIHNLMNILSTHDTARILTSVAGKEMYGKTKDQMAVEKIADSDMCQARKKLKLATLLQFTLCGVPSVYYGDEIGMQGYVDPLNRQTYPWGNEDYEILNWYKFLSKLRREYSAFKNGEFNEIYADNGIFAFTRKNQYSELFIAVNVGDCERNIEFVGELFDLTNNEKYVQKRLLKSMDYTILIKRK